MRFLIPATFLALALTSCAKRAGPDARGPDGVWKIGPDPDEAAAVEKAEPAFRLTAEEFHGQARDEKFQGRVIELSGIVRSVDRNISGEAFVSLDVPGELLGVVCFTTDPHPWATAAPGQRVRVKGRWAPVIGAPRLLYSSFVDTGEYAAVRISAADLAEEYAADAKATVKKYAKKHLVVTGEVTAVHVDEVRAVRIVLKTGNKVPVTCGFTAFDKDVSLGYEPGQTVAVFGEFANRFASDASVDLNFCLPLPAR